MVTPTSKYSNFWVDITFIILWTKCAEANQYDKGTWTRKIPFKVKTLEFQFQKTRDSKFR